jgi:hypothetical protein
MATGTIKWFAQGLHDLGNKIHDLDTDVWKLGIVTGVTPTVATAQPNWGGVGTTNYASNQVVTTGTSYTGPITLGSLTWTLNASGANMDWADTQMQLPQDASGFTNGGYGIIYNNTDANKRAIAYIEISSTNAASLVTGAVNINLNASGALSLSQP